MKKFLRAFMWLVIGLSTLLLALFIHLGQPAGKVFISDSLQRIFNNTFRGTAQISPPTELTVDKVFVPELTLLDEKGTVVLKFNNCELELANPFTEFPGAKSGECARAFFQVIENKEGDVTLDLALRTRKPDDESQQSESFSSKLTPKVPLKFDLKNVRLNDVQGVLRVQDAPRIALNDFSGFARFLLDREGRPILRIDQFKGHLAIREPISLKVPISQLKGRVWAEVNEVLKFDGHTEVLSTDWDFVFKYFTDAKSKPVHLTLKPKGSGAEVTTRLAKFLFELVPVFKVKIDS